MKGTKQFHGLIKSKPKSTLMNKREKKPANRTGKGQMVYPNGKHG